MFKKLILVGGFIFLFPFNLVQAGVIIDEVKILPTEDRFIKLYNQDSFDVDLTNWYIQRKTQTGTSFTSLVTKTYFENKKINANGYFLISRTQAGNSDIVIDNLTLTESNTIQLKNSSGEVVNKVCWGDVNDCGDSKISNPASGESIKFAQDTFVDVPATQDFTDPVSYSPVVELTEPKVIPNPTMKAKILVNVLAFAGQPFEIKTDVTGFSGEKVVLGRVSWNFGDGSSFEQINNFEKFSHIYYYPGEYVLFLEYYSNSFSKTPEATSKTVIKVLSTSVSISKVGDAKDFFIELSNNASSDIDISNWVINANGKTFILPKNSVIMSKKQMTISGRITGFTIGDQNNLKLYSGADELMFDYLLSKVPVVARQDLTTDITTTKTIIQPKISTVVSPAVQPLGNNLEATVLQSGVMSNDSMDNTSMPLIPIISFIFIGASAGTVYFIRRKKVIPKEGEDFEILDE